MSRACYPLLLFPRTSFPASFGDGDLAINSPDVYSKGCCQSNPAMYIGWAIAATWKDPIATPQLAEMPDALAPEPSKLLPYVAGRIDHPHPSADCSKRLHNVEILGSGPTFADPLRAIAASSYIGHLLYCLHNILVVDLPLLFGCRCGHWIHYNPDGRARHRDKSPRKPGHLSRAFRGARDAPQRRSSPPRLYCRAHSAASPREWTPSFS